MDTESEDIGVFEDGELEELKQLTIQHRRGEISDIDFDEKAAWLLKGRGFPILTSIPDLPEKNSDNSDSPLKKLNELSALTSCGERSKRARRSHFRRQQDLRQESLVMKAIQEVDSQKPKNIKSSSDSLTLSANVLTSSIINKNLSSNNNIQPTTLLNKENKNKQNKPIIIAVGLTLLLTITLLTLVFGTRKSNKLVSIAELTPLLIAHQQNPDLPMLFGPVSVSQCNTLCRAKNGENCESVCRKLSFEMFPHRISLRDNSPEALAKRLEESCRKTFKSEGKSNASQKDIGNIDYPSLENLDLNELMKEYALVSSQHGQLRHNTKDNKNLGNSSVALCLRANEIISYIGSIVANSYKDHYSIAYYQLTQKAFANKNAALSPKS